MLPLPAHALIAAPVQPATQDRTSSNPFVPCACLLSCAVQRMLHAQKPHVHFCCATFHCASFEHRPSDHECCAFAVLRQVSTVRIIHWELAKLRNCEEAI